MNTTEIISIISVILGGGFIGAMVAIYKARPERDSVVVTSAQNAALILRGLNDALYSDLIRTRRDRDDAENRADAYESELRKHGVSIPFVQSLPELPVEKRDE
jgi:glycine/D-amino acid oxidase-like deaminating enzyme